MVCIHFRSGIQFHNQTTLDLKDDDLCKYEEPISSNKLSIFQMTSSLDFIILFEEMAHCRMLKPENVFIFSSNESACLKQFCLRGDIQFDFAVSQVIN